MLKFFAVALLGTAAFASQAAATRCEDSAGKVTYQEGACPEGTKAQRNVNAPAPPSDAERQTASQRATQDYKDSEKLRIAREKQENKQFVASTRADKRKEAKARSCSNLALRVKRAQEDEKSVTPKDAEKKKLKRLRLQEDYARECGK
jgi:Domain of unknown function (DUF4124)